MNCTICGKRIILIPSAEERGRKTGQPPAYYRSLFTEHAACALRRRGEETLKLIRSKISGAGGQEE